MGRLAVEPLASAIHHPDDAAPPTTVRLPMVLRERESHRPRRRPGAGRARPRQVARRRSAGADVGVGGDHVADRGLEVR